MNFFMSISSVSKVCVHNKATKKLINILILVISQINNKCSIYLLYSFIYILGYLTCYYEHIWRWKKKFINGKYFKYINSDVTKRDSPRRRLLHKHHLASLFQYLWCSYLQENSASFSPEYNEVRFCPTSDSFVIIDTTF